MCPPHRAVNGQLGIFTMEASFPRPTSLVSWMDYQFWFTNWPSYMKGKEKPKREADHSRLVDGGFNKQGNLTYRLILSSHKTKDLHTCHQSLKSLYRGLNWVQSHILSRWSQLHLTLSRCILGNGAHCEWWGEHMLQG